MSDPVYRKEILRLAADAVGAGALADPDGAGTAHNPACGDRVAMTVAVQDGRITALAHQTQACILTQASAALLAGTAVGANSDALAALEGEVRALLNGGDAPDAPFDTYRAFDGVGAIKGRHVCVLLPVLALRQALEDSEKR